MIPGLLARRLVSTAGAAMAGYVARQAGDAALSFVVNDVPRFEDPVLLVALPAAIVKENLGLIEPPPKFDCPNRAALKEHCTDVAFFDRKTVPPVNHELERRGIKLTKESLVALKRDMDHSNQMSFRDPVHKKIWDYHEASENQNLIARSFEEAHEFEGAFMHDIIKKVFHVRAEMYERVIAPMEEAVRGPSMNPGELDE